MYEEQLLLETLHAETFARPDETLDAANTSLARAADASVMSYSWLFARTVFAVISIDDRSLVMSGSAASFASSCLPESL
jgi:hypothetical protein